MDKVEQVAIMQACANANPSAQRGGYWDDAGQPVTGWVPMLGDMRVSCPDSKRFVFGSEAHAVDAARRFRDRCRKNLVDIGLADDIDGALYVHRDLGPDFVHIIRARVPAMITPEEIEKDKEIGRRLEWCD